MIVKTNNKVGSKIVRSNRDFIEVEKVAFFDYERTKVEVDKLYI